MENASKALIIAGAILISLLIISLGILIYNQATGATGNDGMSKAEIATFNNEYLRYEGVQNGSTIKDLIQKVNINNAQDGSHYVYFSALPQGTGAPTLGIREDSGVRENPGAYQTSSIRTTERYDVTTTTGTSGRIDQISVTLHTH